MRKDTLAAGDPVAHAAQRAVHVLTTASRRCARPDVAFQPESPRVAVRLGCAHLLLEALMKRIPFSPRVALLGVALMTGCAEQRSPTAPADPHAPVFSVERGPAEFGGGFDDGSRVLFAGLTLENLTNLFCEDPFDVDQLSALAVIRPDGSIKEQLRGEANVVVVLAPPEVALTCEGMRTAPHLTGTARVIVNDSDVDGSSPGAGAFRLPCGGNRHRRQRKALPCHGLYPGRLSTRQRGAQSLDHKDQTDSRRLMSQEGQTERVAGGAPHGVDACNSGDNSLRTRSTSAFAAGSGSDEGRDKRVPGRLRPDRAECHDPDSHQPHRRAFNISHPGG